MSTNQTVNLVDLHRSNDINIGRIGVKQLAEQRQIVTERWTGTGLLGDIPEGQHRENIAQLMENQLSHFLSESTVSDSSGSFETVAFPIIRRVFSKLLANDIVTVQALNLPIGLLYYYVPKISVRNVDGTHTAYNGAYQNAATTPDLDKTQFSDKPLYYDFYSENYGDYGDSLFDRSKGARETVTGATTATTAYQSGDTRITLQVAMPSDGQGNLIGPAGQLIDTESFVAGFKVTSDVDFVAPAPYENLSVPAGSSLVFNLNPQRFGQAIVDGNRIFELVVDLTYPGDDGRYTTAMVADTTGTPVFNYQYYTYSDLEEDSEMAEVTFELDNVTVAVETRKMRTNWTPELSQDVSAFHNINAEAELTALLSETMALEIDREVLRDLKNEAAWTLRWNAQGWVQNTRTYYGVEKDWNQSLITKFNQISAQIQKATLKGGASWIVVSTEISAVLDNLEYFHTDDASPEQDKYNMGIERIGNINGRYQVYRDPYAPASLAIIGNKPATALDAGYFYCPYIPMQLTNVLTDPRDFKSVRGIMTRYAKKMVLNHYYGKVVCDNLQTFSGVLR